MREARVGRSEATAPTLNERGLACIMSVDPPPRVSASSSSLESSDRPTEGGISVEPQSLAEARLAGIVSISADAIISIDASHRISLFNLGAQKIFGYTEAEMLGQPLDLLLPEGARGRHQEHIKDFGSSSVDARRSAYQRARPHRA